MDAHSPPASAAIPLPSVRVAAARSHPLLVPPPRASLAQSGSQLGRRFETSALRGSDVDALEYGMEGMQIEPDDHDDVFGLDDDADDGKLSFSPRSPAAPVGPLAFAPASASAAGPRRLSLSMSPDHATLLGTSLGTPSLASSIPRRTSSTLSRSLRSVHPSSPSSMGLRLLRTGSKTRRSSHTFAHSAPYSPALTGRRYSSHVRAPLPASPSAAELAEEAEAAAAASILVGSYGSYCSRVSNTDGDETDEEVPVCLSHPADVMDDEPPAQGWRRPSAPAASQTWRPRPASSRPSALSRSLHAVVTPRPPSGSFAPPQSREGESRDSLSADSLTDTDVPAETSPESVPEPAVGPRGPEPPAAAYTAKAVHAIRSQIGNASCPAFVTKLWYLLNTPAQYQRYISWSQAGDKILIAADTTTSSEFATLVLPTLYRHNNLASFVRQLNLYGFQRISTTRPLDPSEVDLAVSKNMLAPSAAQEAKAAAEAVLQAQARAESETDPALQTQRQAEAATALAAAVALTPGLTAATLYGPHNCFSHPRFQRNHPEWLPQLKPRSSKKPKPRLEEQAS